MESSVHGLAPVRDQVKNVVPHTQSISESYGIMAWDGTSYNEDAEDEELVRKRKQLQFIEEQIARKKASIALKKGELQQGPLCYNSDDENELADPTGIRDTQVGTEMDIEKCPLFTNNISQKPTHQEAISLTEKQISILNELTEPFLSSLKPSMPATPSIKTFLEKRNTEILQRDLGQRRGTFGSDLNTAFSPEHKVETLRPQSEALRTLTHLLPPPVDKTNPGQPSSMKTFLEKRNEEILQRDVKEKRVTELDYNQALASEDKVEALRLHSHLHQALPSAVYKSPAEQLAPSSLNISTRTSNHGPPSQGFDRFLNILNQGVDFRRLSDIVSAAESEVENNKPAASATEIYTHHETIRSVSRDRSESRDKHTEMREKERGSRSQQGDFRDCKSPLKDCIRETKEDRGSGAWRSDFRDSHKHSHGWESRRDSGGRDQGKDLRERDRDWDLRERDRGWEWKGGESLGDSRKIHKEWDSTDSARDRDCERDSRDRSWKRERDSRDRRWEKERYSDNRRWERERDSRDRSWERKSNSNDRSWERKSNSNDRSWERKRDSRDRSWERERYSRDRSLELRDSLWDRGGESKTGYWAREWRDKNSHVRNTERDFIDRLSPRRSSSRDRWSRSRSRSTSPSSEDERKRSRRGQLSNIQLSSKVKERLTENRYPRGRRERRRQGHLRSSSWSDSSDDYSPDIHYRQHDSRDAERPWWVSGMQCSFAGNSVSPAPQSMPLSTLPHPPPANCLSHTVMMQHKSYDGQQHNASVQTWTSVGWSGVPSACAPQFTPLPLLATDSNNAPYQCPPPQHPPHLGPPPQLPPSSVPTPDFLMPSMPPPNLPPPSIPPPNLPPSTNLMFPPSPCNLTLLIPPPSYQFPLPHLQQSLRSPLSANPSCSPSTNLPLIQPQTLLPKRMISDPNHRLANRPRQRDQKRVLKVLAEDPTSGMPPKTTSTSTPVTYVSTAPPETTVSTSTETTSVSTALKATITSTITTSTTTATTSSAKTGVTRPSKPAQVVSFSDYRKREEKNLLLSPFARLLDRKHRKQLAWMITNMAAKLAATAVAPADSGGTDTTTAQTTAAEQHPACCREQKHPLFPFPLSKKLKKRIRQEKTKILKAFAKAYTH